MSNQDMQFVDPEWRPTEQRDVNVDQREQEVPPQPINADLRERRQRQNVPPFQEGYRGPGYAGSQPGMMSDRWYGPVPTRRYRRRSPWRWIVVLLIILALAGGGVGSVFGIHHTSTETKNFTVSTTTAPTLVIHESTGEITVHAGSTNSISIQATKDAGGFFGNPNGIQVQYNRSNDGNTINVSANDGGGIFSSSSVNFDVTVPTNTDLQLQSNTGTIEVHDVTGTMDLESNTGTITATDDTLTGSSTLHTDTGSVNFSGSISSGNYRFTTNTGSVNVSLPRDSSFHVDAKTDTGSVNTDFPGLSQSIQHNTVGAELHADVGGNASQTNVTLTTNTGSVDLRQG